MPRARRLPAAILCCAAVALAACSERAQQQPDQTRPDQIYRGVRGVVADLPDPARPVSNFVVHHERIDDFVNGAGEVVGMAEMQMPFPLAEGVSIEGLAIGDKIEFTFEVRWDRSRTPPLPSWHLTEWTRLPPETELHFGGSD